MIIIIINNTIVEIWQTAKSKNHINFSNFWDQTCWTNSGFKNEKPSNSFWSRFSMKSLSGGVNLVVSSVNCLSKFDTSLWCFYKKIFILNRIQNTIVISWYLFRPWGQRQEGSLPATVWFKLPHYSIRVLAYDILFAKSCCQLLSLCVWWLYKVESILQKEL